MGRWEGQMLKIRVVLADDHQIVREGVASLLAKEPGIEVVGTARNGREAVRLVRDLKPHVIVMDISMPDLNGIEATRQVLSVNPNLKVITLSMHTDKRFVVGMFRAGASAYLLKDCAHEELALAVRTVCANKVYLSSAIAGVVVEELARQDPSTESSPIPALTSREREVLQLIAEGHTTKLIASKLFVSVKTIETHRQSTMDKLDLHSIAALTKYAVREGLTSLDT